MSLSCSKCKGTNLEPHLNGKRLGIICVDCETIVEDGSNDDEGSESNSDTELISGNPAADSEDRRDGSPGLASYSRSVPDEKKNGEINNDGVHSVNVSQRSDKSVCPACKGHNVGFEIIDDSEQYVCRDCGSFVEQQNLISHGEYAPISGRGDVLYGWTRAPKPKFARERQHVAQGKLSAIKTVRDVCSQLKLGPVLEEQAVALFEKMYAVDSVAFFRTDHKNAMGVCCAYVVARQNHVQLTMKTLQKIHPVKPKIFSKCINLIQKETKQPLQCQRLNSLVPHVLSGHSDFDGDFQEKVGTLATVLEEGYLAQGRDYTNVIITLAYLVWMNGDPGGRKKTTFPKFCERFRFHCSHTAQGLLSLTKDLLVKLADQLPWVRRKVTKKDVVHYIQDIVRYNRSVLSRAAKQTEDVSDAASVMSISSGSSDSTETNGSVSPLIPPAMKKPRIHTQTLRTDRELPENVVRSDLDKEDLGETEFDDEIVSYLLSPEEVKMKSETLML